jgi:hypothetical protein
VEAKVQFRISEKDQILSDLWYQLKRQEELSGKRGYASNRIRDMVKAYKLISDHFEESDPYRLMMKIASSQRASEPSEEVLNEPEEVMKSKIDSNTYLQQLDSFANI